MFNYGNEVNSLLWLIVAIIAAIPLIVFLKSYLKVRSRNFLFLAAAYSLFLVKAITLSMNLFISQYEDETWWTLAAFLDILIMVLIVLSLTRKE